MTDIVEIIARLRQLTRDMMEAPLRMDRNLLLVEIRHSLNEIEAEIGDGVHDIVHAAECPGCRNEVLLWRVGHGSEAICQGCGVKVVRLKQN